MSYAELQTTTHFSFLRGASSPEELFATAALLGVPALGVTDRNSLAGIVRCHEAAKATGIRLIVGCRLDLACGTSLLVYPTDRAVYGRLCRLLTVGKGRAGKGKCRLDWSDVLEHGNGLLAVLVPDRQERELAARLDRLHAEFGDRAYVALTPRFRPNEAMRLDELAALARRHRVATLATNDVLYHSEERRILQDVVTAVREKCTVDALGYKRERFADRFLKSPAAMARLLKDHPGAVARTLDGAATTSMVATHVLTIKALVLVAGIYDLGQIYPSGQPGIDAYIEREAGTTPEAFASRAALRYFDRINATTLILHGEKDAGTVHQAEELAEKLHARGLAVRLHVYKDTPHSIPITAQWEEITPFLNQLLGQ